MKARQHNSTQAYLPKSHFSSWLFLNFKESQGRVSHSLAFSSLPHSVPPPWTLPHGLSISYNPSIWKIPREVHKLACGAATEKACTKSSAFREAEALPLRLEADRLSTLWWNQGITSSHGASGIWIITGLKPDGSQMTR